MIAMLDNEGASIASLAEKAGWLTGAGLAHKSKVHRILTALKRDHIVVNKRGTWALSESGTKEAKKAKSNTTLAGAKYD